ncbi:cytochrome P450 [Suillus subalutaceus]|uniref:cytochrome P450 n=1 Tax=Suillus subalutaceus TaxID=48586 RepID=UPI001B86915C|nr:cytochrome P450 [Suillus subalutaceus]KAG1837792.1 cytochrome P450 [Suillus subalutaceus]
MFPSVDGRFVILAVLPASFVFIKAFTRLIQNRQNKPCLRPGPVPLPLLGNVLSIDTKEPWLTYTEWAAAHGDLVFVRLLGQEVVVINSQHVAEALMDKRSRIYSDRPYLATVEPFGWSDIFAFTGYGDEWRLARRLFHQSFRPESALKFRPMQIKKAREMVINLIDDSQHYHSHFATFSSSIAMSVTYGYQTSPRDDPLVRIAESALVIGLQVMTPEKAILLKIFPFLLRLPDWCWGSAIKRDAQVSTHRMTEMTDLPFQYAQEHMAEDLSLGQVSMVSDNLQRMEKLDQSSKPIFETALKKAAATAIVGSYETTTSTLMTFSLAMVLYPDIQKRAQAEIDSVVGADRLPTFEDRASLPYVESVLRETWRWHPVGVLGVPHATSNDDTYDGYFIPKGLLFSSSEQIFCDIVHQERPSYLTYGAFHGMKSGTPDASSFIPERFLDVNNALTDDDPAEYVFGFGRRACPGRHAADASVWSAIVTMLATVEFSSAKDDQGKVIEFTPQFTTGLTQYLVFLVSFHFLGTNSSIVLAALWSSLAISQHALVPIQNLWMFSEREYDMCSGE